MNKRKMVKKIKNRKFQNKYELDVLKLAFIYSIIKAKDY
jgi:hypothetical protein